MQTMFSPPHPGKVLHEYLAGIPVSVAANVLGVSRSTLSRILSKKSRISPDVAIRLGQALGTSADLWLRMQSKFDLFEAGKLASPGVRRQAAQGQNESQRKVKGMVTSTPGRKVSINDMDFAFAREMAAWDNVSPVGREFGSPDYERLAALDHLAWMAMGSMLKARRWLDKSHPDLGGLSPEAFAKTKTGYQRVLRMLRGMPRAKK